MSALRRGVLAAAAGLAVAAFVAACGGDNGPALVEVPVRGTDFVRSVREQGVVEAQRVVELTAPFGGRVVAIADTGATVEAGDLVVQFDDQSFVDDLNNRLEELERVRTDLEATIQRLEIAIRTNRMDEDFAQSELALRRIELQEASAQLSQTQALRDRQLVSQDEVTSTLFSASNQRLSTIADDFVFRTQLTTSEARESSSLLEIEQFGLRGQRAQRRLLEADQRIDDAAIRAPIGGVFLRKASWSWAQRQNVEVNPGDRVRRGQILAEIPDLDSLIVRTQVPESVINDVALGAEVRLVFDGLQGAESKGRVASIARAAVEREASAGGSLVQSDSFSGQKVFEIVVEFVERPAGIRPGLTAEVEVVLARSEGVLAVPIHAVERREGRMMVRVANREGWEWREVRIGEHNQDFVVLTEGVREGDRLLAAPLPGSSSRQRRANS